MATQPEDQKTADIFDHPAVTDAKRAAEKAEELHLAAEHKLIKVDAFIRDERKAEKRTKTAERVDKFREKQRAAGLVQFAIPAEVAASVKTTEGGFAAWLQAQKAAPVEKIVEVERIVPVEKIVEVERPVPVELSVDEKRLIKIGRLVESSRGWRRSLIKRLLGIKS